MFRSVEMSYVQVLLPAAVADEFADLVGREGCIQFTDLNEDFQPFQRRFTADIIKVQEIERQVKQIEEQLVEYKVRFDSAVSADSLSDEPRRGKDSQIVENIAREVNDNYTRLKQQSTAEHRLKTELLSQEATIDVLGQMDRFLSERRELVAERLGASEIGVHVDSESSPTDAVPLMSLRDPQNRDVGFKYFAGVVTTAQRVSFERQVFLTSRGNSFIQFDDSVDVEADRIPFVVFFLGDQLKRSLKRLCQFMNIQICYESDSERSREDLLQEANSKRTDYRRIHAVTRKQLSRDMEAVAVQLREWKIALLQEKAIRITLNKFRAHQGNNVLRAEGWCPTAQRTTVEGILDDVTRNKGVGRAVLTDQSPIGEPPTHFLLNEFTAAFQLIVDTYGVPRYQEFNPAVPTIITFPFLFGVMYGDIFHGTILFLAACLLCLAPRFMDVSKSEMLGSMYGGRYVLILMGAMAIYCGIIYNDCMSIKINGFNKTQWTHSYDDNGDLVMYQHNVYAFGVDPAWHDTDTLLTFENSLKMKLSVIIGVIQMTFGLLIKCTNHLHEGDWISLIFEFIPQFIFMIVFFGYMIFMIFYKWCIDWKTSGLPNTPSLITVLIKFVLAPGTINDEVQLYDPSIQKPVQTAFLILMFGSIPVMLLVKPLLLRYIHEHRPQQLEEAFDAEQPRQLLDASEEDRKEEAKEERPPVVQAGGGHGHGAEFDFGEIMIHQLIHTIEYVLGTISNTASYLRLWALSLAHSELSEVFYEKTLVTTLTGAQPLLVVETVVAVFVFFLFTFGVLCIMDVLECFLHALRLHWVEFQNKFYYADGVAFKPFSYKAMFAEENE